MREMGIGRNSPLAFGGVFIVGRCFSGAKDHRGASRSSSEFERAANAPGLDPGPVTRGFIGEGR